MKKDFCCLTYFHKEAFYIPFWQNYYGELFGFENLFAASDLEKDYTFKLFHKDVNKLEFGETLLGDVNHHVNFIRHWQSSLLTMYDTVIFAEVDQYFVPNLQKYKHLRDFLEKNNDDYFRPMGYNVIRDLDNEPIYDPRKPILSQRKWWHRELSEDKTAIIRKPVEWYHTGFHFSRPEPLPHPDLVNIHFHEFDFEVQNTRKAMRKDTNIPNHPTHKPGGQGPVCFIEDEELWNYHKERFNNPKKGYMNCWSDFVVEEIPLFYREANII